MNTHKLPKHPISIRTKSDGKHKDQELKALRDTNIDIEDSTGIPDVDNDGYDSDQNIYIGPKSSESTVVVLKECGSDKPIGSLAYFVSLDPFALFQVDFHGLFLHASVDSPSTFSRFLKAQETVLRMKGAKKFSSFPLQWKVKLVEALEANQFSNFGKILAIEYAPRDVVLSRQQDLIDYNLELGYLEYEQRSKKLYHKGFKEKNSSKQNLEIIWNFQKEKFQDTISNQLKIGDFEGTHNMFVASQNGKFDSSTFSRFLQLLVNPSFANKMEGLKIDSQSVFFGLITKNGRVVGFLKIVNMFTIAVMQQSFVIDTFTCTKEEEANWEEIFAYALYQVHKVAINTIRPAYLALSVHQGSRSFEEIAGLSEQIGFEFKNMYKYGKENDHTDSLERL